MGVHSDKCEDTWQLVNCFSYSKHFNTVSWHILLGRTLKSNTGVE